MLDFFCVTLILTGLTCCLTCYYWFRHLPNRPPGTQGLPLLGILHIMRSHPEKIFQKLSKKYGPLYMVKLAWFNVVVISDPDIAFEAFAKNTCFNDRIKSIALFSGNYGIIMMNHSDFQKEQRRFSLLTLRSFGMGQRNLELYVLEVLHNSCCEIVDLMKKSGGECLSYHINNVVYYIVFQIISMMVFGCNIMEKRKTFKEIFERFIVGPKHSSILIALVSMVPALKHVPPFSNIWKVGILYQHKFHQEIKSVIDEHKNSLDRNNPRDYIDCFLIQIEKSVKKNTDLELNNAFMDNNSSCDERFSNDWKPLSSFSEEQLVAAVRDLFVAGLDTSSSSLCWIILYLCKYEDVQRKMHQEIMTNLGETKSVSMSMIEKFPFVRSVIQEVTRLRPLAPLALPHLASRDATLRNYTIPKGAVILTNIWAIHHDERRWPEPEKFFPERHIDSNGKFSKSPNWMHFNVGGRSCLGQQLANMELFLTTVTLFQRFHFSLPPGEEPDMNGKSAIVLKPPVFRVIATKY